MHIESIAVIGASGLGCRLAALSLRAGCRTILEDMSIAALERAAAAIQVLRASDSSPSATGTIDASGAAAPPLVFVHSVEEAVRDADFIIEAVSDELEMKLELFTIFDKFAKPGAIFASTTTSLSIADLAAITFCPERCVGLCLVTTQHGSQGLQIVATNVTSDETLAACCDFARACISRSTSFRNHRSSPPTVYESCENERHGDGSRNISFWRVCV